MQLKKQVDTLTVRFDSMCTHIEVLTSQVTGQIINTSLSKPFDTTSRLPIPMQPGHHAKEIPGASLQTADPINPKTFLSEHITNTPCFSSISNRATNPRRLRMPTEIPDYFTNMAQNEEPTAFTSNTSEHLTFPITNSHNATAAADSQADFSWPDMPPHNIHKNITDALFPNPAKCEVKQKFMRRSFIPSEPFASMDFNLPPTYFSSQQLTTLNLTNPDDHELQIGVVGRRINNNYIELAEH